LVSDETRDGERGSGELPESFYTVTLPRIESLAELKVTLHLHWLLTRHGGAPAVSLSALEGDRLLLAGLKPGPGPRPVEEIVRQGLELAVTRGTFLHLTVGDGGDSGRRWYLLNTRENRETVRRLAKGEISAVEALGEDVGPVELIRVYRPNVFSLYEQTIGLLTPTVAGGLRDAERVYPAEWIVEAMRLAVEYNKRSWPYVEGILKRWETEGKSVGTDRQHSETHLDSEKYTTGRYGHLVES
jgi:DnaD/phage-associated family protein